MYQYTALVHVQLTGNSTYGPSESFHSQSLFGALKHKKINKITICITIKYTLKNRIADQKRSVSHMCKWPEWDSHTAILKCQPHWNVSRILSAQPLLTPALTKEYQFYPLNLSPNWFSLSMLISLGYLHSRDACLSKMKD